MSKRKNPVTSEDLVKALDEVHFLPNTALDNPPNIKLQYRNAKRHITPEERRAAYERDLRAEYDGYYAFAKKLALSLPKAEVSKPLVDTGYEADQETILAHKL